MKRLKTIVIIGVSVLMISGCSSASASSRGNEKYRENFEYVSTNDTMISEIRDIKTGVHYYIRSSGNRGGMTPVIESDGSIRITNK